MQSDIDFDTVENPFGAEQQIPEVAERLPGLPFEVRRAARVIASVVSRTKWAAGKSPKAIAASCIYLADLVYNREERYSQTDFDKYDIVSDLTIRQQYRHLPALFLEHATEDDIALLGAHPDQEYVIETLEFLKELNDEEKALDAPDWRPEIDGVERSST